MPDPRPTATLTVTDADIRAVEAHLAELWQGLPSAQRAVLDLVMAAAFVGVDGVPADTAGYNMSGVNPRLVVESLRWAAYRTAEAAEDVRREPVVSPHASTRWDLRNLIERNAALLQQQSGAEGDGGA